MIGFCRQRLTFKIQGEVVHSLFGRNLHRSSQLCSHVVFVFSRDQLDGGFGRLWALHLFIDGRRPQKLPDTATRAPISIPTARSGMGAIEWRGLELGLAITFPEAAADIRELIGRRESRARYYPKQVGRAL
jgi:hypothetical protein